MKQLVCMCVVRKYGLMQGERMALMEYIVGTPFSQTDCAGYLDSDTHPGLQVS